MAPALYLIAAAVISLRAVLTLRETAGLPLPQTSDARLAAAIQ